MKKRYWIAGAATLAIAGKLLTASARCRLAQEPRRCFSFRAFALHRRRWHPRSLPGSRRSEMRPRLFLIHGFASSTLVWSKVFLRFAEAGYRVIAVDMLGYGYSAKPRNGEYTIPGQAKLLTRLLDALGIPRAIFVGSSYGGAVAATCALDYPDRVEKLILVGTVNNNRPLRVQVDARVWFASCSAKLCRRF